jgi:hypothetical protein
MGGAESCLACDAKRGADSSKPERKPITTPVPGGPVTSCVPSPGNINSNSDMHTRVLAGKERMLAWSVRAVKILSALFSTRRPKQERELSQYFA